MFDPIVFAFAILGLLLASTIVTALLAGNRLGAAGVKIGDTARDFNLPGGVQWRRRLDTGDQPFRQLGAFFRGKLQGFGGKRFESG